MRGPENNGYNSEEAAEFSSGRRFSYRGELLNESEINNELFKLMYLNDMGSIIWVAELEEGLEEFSEVPVELVEEEIEMILGLNK